MPGVVADWWTGGQVSNESFAQSGSVPLAT